MFKSIIYSLPVIIISLCACGNKKLAYALDAAGNNRSELESVLRHYSEKPEDSLKLKAAVFLIENMPGHVSAYGDEINAVYDRVNGILDLDLPWQTARDSINKIIENCRHKVFRYDVEIIKAEYLIKNIDDTFELWSGRWAKHLTFDQFCEYLLPYKYAEGQRLDMWRDSLKERYVGAIDQILPDDEVYDYACTAAGALNKQIKSILKYRVIYDMSRNGICPFYNSSSIYRFPYADCNAYSSMLMAMQRSCGIAAVSDFLPQWGGRSKGKHGWFAIYNNGKFLPSPFLGNSIGQVFMPTQKVPKVYRNQYANNEERAKYVGQAKYVYNTYTRFEKDVTSEYIATSDLEIPVNTSGLKDKFVHIAVSDFQGWDIVDYGVLKNRKAHFKDMGRKIVYLIYGFDGTDLIPISEPFYLGESGEIRYFRPDKNNLEKADLYRKYPKARNTAQMEQRLLKTRIEASDNADFKQTVTVFKIEYLNFPDLIPTNIDTAYRYWRYIGETGGIFNIAELQFFNSSDKETPVAGKIIGSKDDPKNYRARAFDGDWLTFYDSGVQNEPVWIGLDFGEPVNVDYIRCIPRSDDNSVRYGETYELVYWENGRWNSLGKQVASEKYLTYDSIPGNSLLLLKNLSRGKEERIFNIDNGKQVWY